MPAHVVGSEHIDDVPTTDKPIRKAIGLVPHRELCPLQEARRVDGGVGNGPDIEEGVHIDGCVAGDEAVFSLQDRDHLAADEDPWQAREEHWAAA